MIDLATAAKGTNVLSDEDRAANKKLEIMECAKKFKRLPVEWKGGIFENIKEYDIGI